MFCINCGERIEPGERFCVACGQPAESQADGGYGFGAGFEAGFGMPPVAGVSTAAPRAVQRRGGSGAALAILATGALGAALFASVCAVLAILAMRATVGGGMLAAFGDIPPGEAAAVTGGADRGAFLAGPVFAASAAIAALIAFDIFVLNTGRTKRALGAGG
ncbi:MAG: zinc ribbon domain-containing protein, partial [Oscillospiraceae bacterium]|nr:zinc ribbon domain-containing protein [Oscillospiraceae bacterium]